MCINELEAKARELRQLQALIEEAQTEAEAIKDAIKAAMGDSETIAAGEYRSPGSLSPAPDWMPAPCARLFPTWPPVSPRKPPSAASVWHEKGPLHQPAKTEMQEALNKPRRGACGHYITRPLPTARRNF